MKPTLFVFSLLALAAGCTNVEPGHVGVRINKCSGGGIDPAPVGIGYHAVGPCTQIVEYPIFQQNLILTKAATEGTVNDDSITVTSSEGLPTNVDTSLSFTIDAAKVPEVYAKYRQNIEHIEHGYIRQTIREALQETFAKYTAQQLYSDKKEFARAEAQELLSKKLGPNGFNVVQFTVNETRVPEEVTKAINDKVAMSQMAQKAEQEIRMKEALAKQTIVGAQAEADGKKLRADAEAYANKKVAESISPVLVEYLKVQKWNGVLPQVQGGGRRCSTSVR